MTAREIGQRVCKLRMAKGWTQKRCAARAKITSRTLEMIESHRTLPTLPTAKKLAMAFKCTWDEILGKP